jgi:APA family basic amino acid/polyamine antiporter
MAEHDHKLKREAGLFQVVAYGVGNIIGAGIYVLVGGAAGLSGNSLWLGFIVAASVALLTGLSYAELSAMYPKSASEYTYLGRAYGNRLISFITEWLMIISEIVAASTIALGFAQYFQSFFAAPPILVAASLLVLLTLISIIGIRASLKLNTVLSAVAVIGLLIVIAAGAGKIGSVDYLSPSNGLSGIFAASALVFFAYMGFDNIANLAEETKNPQKTLPRSLMIAMAISTLLYVLVGLSVVSLVPWQTLSSSGAPLALAVSEVFGPTAYTILAVIALLTTFNTALVVLISGSRAIYGMAREGALPRILGNVHGRTHTPIFASLLILFITFIVLQIGNIDTIAEITSAGALVVFALVNLSILHLRKTAPHLKRPIRVPFNIGWVPVTSFLGLISCIGLLTRFNTTSLVYAAALPVSGVIVYLLFNRRRLLHDGRIHERRGA